MLVIISETVIKTHDNWKRATSAYMLANVPMTYDEF